MWPGRSGVLINPGQRHCEARLACRGNLNSLHDLEFEIAALPLVARNDEKSLVGQEPLVLLTSPLLKSCRSGALGAPDIPATQVSI